MDPNANCDTGTCQCNTGYYDDDGMADNMAGTCTLRMSLSQMYYSTRIKWTSPFVFRVLGGFCHFFKFKF